MKRTNTILVADDSEMIAKVLGIGTGLRLMYYFAQLLYMQVKKALVYYLQGWATMAPKVYLK
jgi:hypothetical protein